jgi:hypothetical protein
LHLFPDKVAAFLGREDAMNQFTGLGVRHRFSRPCGTASVCGPSQTLKRWATGTGPYGTKYGVSMQP